MNHHIGWNLHQDVSNVEDTETGLVLRLAQIQIVFQASKLCSSDVVTTTNKK
jgi:hypothetical protein